MSLTGIANSARSLMHASQQQLRVASNNVANVNTPGYVRAQANLSASIIAGRTVGVEVNSITRAADRFLAAANRNADSAQSAAAVRTELLDRAQASFGDPTESGSIFAQLDDAYTNLSALAQTPQSALLKSQAVDGLSSLFTGIKTAANDIEGLRLEADSRLQSAIERTNGLLEDIYNLNEQIRVGMGSGGDYTGAENAQGALIDELATLIDINVTDRAGGGVELRTTSGLALVSISGAAQLHYGGGATAFAAPGSISLVDTTGALRPFGGDLKSGEIAGLLQVRDQDLPSLSEALGGLAAGIAEALNAAHNAASATPPLNTLSGRNTGLVDADGLNFTGKTSIGVVDSNGVLRRKIEIDFDAGTIAVDGAAAATYVTAAPATIGQLETALNNALTGASAASGVNVGSADFSEGKLSLIGGAGYGIVVQDDATVPSDRAGRGFSHFFGLNDLVTRPSPTYFETGVSGSDAGFAGGAINFRVLDSSGRVVAEPSVNAVASSIAAQLTAINTYGSGLAPYGQLSGPGADGRIILSAASGYTIDVVGDSTTRGDTGLSFSSLFGLGRSATATRATDLEVRADIANNPNNLAVAQPDLTQALGEAIIEEGDGRGAQLLAQSNEGTHTFRAAGALPEQTTTLALYASAVAGQAGGLAAIAERAQSSAQSLANIAKERRAASEGVSLDDELVKMTQYQQSYAAAARLIQAVSDMWDTLLSIR